MCLAQISSCSSSIYCCQSMYTASCLKQVFLWVALCLLHQSSICVFFFYHREHALHNLASWAYLPMVQSCECFVEISAQQLPVSVPQEVKDSFQTYWPPQNNYIFLAEASTWLIILFPQNSRLYSRLHHLILMVNLRSSSSYRKNCDRIVSFGVTVCSVFSSFVTEGLIVSYC